MNTEEIYEKWKDSLTPEERQGLDEEDLRIAFDYYLSIMVDNG